MESKIHITNISIAELKFSINSIKSLPNLNNIWLKHFNTFYKPYLNKQHNFIADYKFTLTPRQDWQIKSDSSKIQYQKEKSSLGLFDYRKKVGEFDIFSSFFQFDFFLRAIFSLLITKHSGTMLHASSIAVKNNFYIFCGPKKIGKSTIVRLCPYTNKIYADDNTIIKQKKEKIYLFPTPFWEKQNNQFKVQKLNPRPINKLYFLKHGSKNEIREIKDKKRKINLLWKTLKSPNYPPKLLKLTFLEIEFFPSTKIWKKLIKK